MADCTHWSFRWTGAQPLSRPSPGCVGTQLALYRSLLSLRAALLLLVEYAHTPWSCARLEYQFTCPSFISPLLHLEKEPFGHILIGSDIRPSVVPQQGGVFIRHPEMRLHSVSGESPLLYGSQVLHLGVNDKFAVGHGIWPPIDYRVNPQS